MRSPLESNVRDLELSVEMAFSTIPGSVSSRFSVSEDELRKREVAGAALKYNTTNTFNANRKSQKLMY